LDIFSQIFAPVAVLYTVKKTSSRHHLNVQTWSTQEEVVPNNQTLIGLIPDSTLQSIVMINLLLSVVANPLLLIECS